MKHLFKTLYFFVTLTLFIACSSDDDSPREPYYQFNSDEKELIIDYDYAAGQKIIYKNQENETIEFNVISNEQRISESFSRGTFSGGGIFEHSYDDKIIRIEIIDNCIGSGLTGDRTKLNYIFSKKDDEFNNGINFPLWNVLSSSFIDDLINPINIFMTEFNNTQTSEMMINGHLFTNVITVNSGSSENDNFLYCDFMMQKNVNQIFYDYDFGIVQFNDVHGNEWKLIYPE
ncbi:hypothetical protein [uncultured Aquimarina sp.]|uniref:hypothetical protein n=1 Tax=uncultured Aquimarina sp. TaxID=575652 RepID=UPI00262DDEDA|nr:hypothetical protein [uncultured Aquimarina sp.]